MKQSWESRPSPALSTKRSTSKDCAKDVTFEGSNVSTKDSRPLTMGDSKSPIDRQC
jgi:hypothetical protein